MRTILTLIGPQREQLLPRIMAYLAEQGLRAEGPDWLSPDYACDLFVSAPLEAVLPHEAALRALGGGDVVCQADASDTPRKKRLLIADMDSTILVGESLDELAAYAGLHDAIAAITARAMNGELDFRAALRQRVGMLQGLPEGTIAATLARMQLMPGAAAFVGTMRAHGAYCALVSGGFTQFTAAVREQAGFHADFSNQLEIVDGALSGQVLEPILDKDAKLATLQRLAAERNLPLAATLAIGDGANDLPMLQAAGLGIAFCAKPTVAAAARVRINGGDLRAALYVQGYRDGEIVGTV
jgi:phosphoserine phosphatase